MSILITLLLIAFLTFILNIIIIQSNNFIFMVFKKPPAWIVFMGLLSFSYFFIGSQLGNSFNIVWWSALLAFILQLPPMMKKDGAITEEKKNKIVDAMYNEMGIESGRLKYRIGLACYLVGGILGWFLFYGQTISI